MNKLTTVLILNGLKIPESLNVIHLFYFSSCAYLTKGRVTGFCGVC